MTTFNTPAAIEARIRPTGWRQISAWAAAALLLSACATRQPVTTTPPKSPAAPTLSALPAPAPLRSIVVQQERLYRVAAPLLTQNAPLCKANARNLLGFSAKNKYSFPKEFVADAQKAYGLDEQLQVIQVLTDSGAERAGIKRGDRLVSVNDKPFPLGPNAERQAATILGPLVRNRSLIKLTVARNDKNIPLSIPLTRACAFAVELGNADNVNAYADGQRVMITRGMLDFVQSDAELALVLAREFAHNALAHASKQKMSATIGGIIDNLIRHTPDLDAINGMAGIKAYPQNFDAAADNLSLYMLARAGYPIDNAAAFWQRLDRQYPATILNGYTAIHPATGYRLATIAKTVAEIQAKQANKKPLLP
ncbi:M48 family metalloprotease [Herminiimonas sp. CN]|uniref:M48 family metalloprotease n=1 Tax=Herminiimonas sp. CN TaxID=1349818 RepID=UPI000AD6D613|nr:M48 family metalloprotease [Herminiimonas sp. CN]